MSGLPGPGDPETWGPVISPMDPRYVESDDETEVEGVRVTPIRGDGSLIISTVDVASAVASLDDLAQRLEQGEFDHLTIEAYRDREGYEFRVIALRDDRRRDPR